MFSFILTHIGTKRFPDYIYDSIEQIRLFHPNDRIYLAINKKIEYIDYARIDYLQCKIVWIENLDKTKAHIRFNHNSKFQKFWKVTAERFFIIEEVMRMYNIRAAIHIENDNMIYENLDLYYKIITNDFDGIAFTKDNENRAIAGIVFVSNIEKLYLLNDYLAMKHDKKFYSEMQIIGEYLSTTKLKLLPVVYPEYIFDNCFENSKLEYSYMCDAFGGIFDAAAIGQYLGGKDKRNYRNIITAKFDMSVDTGIKPYINPNAWYQVNKMKIVWKKNENALWVPYALTEKKSYRIFNIHVHSKELFRFKSNSRSM